MFYSLALFWFMEVAVVTVMGGIGAAGFESAGSCVRGEIKFENLGTRIEWKGIPLGRRRERRPEGSS
jgi:hypothetical protein